MYSPLLHQLPAYRKAKEYVFFLFFKKLPSSCISVSTLTDCAKIELLVSMLRVFLFQIEYVFILYFLCWLKKSSTHYVQNYIQAEHF